MKIIFKLFIFLIFIAGVLFFLNWFFLGAPGEDKPITFTVPQKQDNFDLIAELQKQNLIKNSGAFKLIKDNLYTGKEIASGGFYLNQNLTAWEILNKITGKPDLLWISINYCLRKEQIGEIIGETLGWSESQLQIWNTIYSTKSEYYEGVYYPDTYLIPVTESPDQVAQRFINRFNEKFAPLSDKYITKNIKWTTGLKIASLIAREAAGTEDMKLISGIIWNRLDQDMRLQIDATMQYTLGKNDQGKWWGAIDLEQKQSDSPYNSYRHEGLPPTPICSPNIDAIEAALNPETTDCIFYLHDKNKLIHCAVTYEEHKENITKYLN